MSLPAVEFWRSPLLARITGLCHGVSGRAGGVSRPPFDSLNLGFHVGGVHEAVLTNRQRAAEAFGAPLSSWVCAQQVHGSQVRPVGTPDRGRGSQTPEGALPETDALVTAEAGVTLTVFIADCAPVFLVDPETRALGLAHAGWRGLAAGIVTATVTAMVTHLGAKLERLVSAVGPSLGPCCFEVGEEVAARFDPVHVVRRPEAVRPHLDSWAVIRSELRALGVPAANIEQPPPCTHCHPADYFSHRASGGRTGRAAALLSWRP